MIKETVALCAIVAILTGCSTSTPEPAAEKSRGREETRKLEAASMAGYDGAAVRKTVDNTLDKTDNRNQDLDKAMKTTGEERPNQQ